MGWFLDSLEWTSGKLLSGAGHVASLVGATDTGELLKSAGDPTYVPEAYRKGTSKEEAKRFTRFAQQKADSIAEKTKPVIPYSYVVIDAVDEDGKALRKYSANGKPIPTTKEAREQHMKESNELNTGIKDAALNTESALWLPVEATEAVIDPYGVLSFGGFGMDIASNIMKNRGEAPPATFRARFAPVWLGGDAHYLESGHPEDHPDRPKTGTHDTGIVGPTELAGGVVDTGKNIAHAVGSLPELWKQKEFLWEHRNDIDWYTGKFRPEFIERKQREAKSEAEKQAVEELNKMLDGMDASLKKIPPTQPPVHSQPEASSKSPSKDNKTSSEKTWIDTISEFITYLFGGSSSPDNTLSRQTAAHSTQASTGMPLSFSIPSGIPGKGINNTVMKG